MHSIEVAILVSVLGGCGRHGYKTHEMLFEEISFGRPKSNQMKNIFYSMFEATPSLMSETINLETLS